MAPVYDTSFKELVTHHFASLLPWLLPDVAGGEVVRLSEELPATLRRADLIIRSACDAASPTLFLIECQCQQDPDLPRDLLLRAALAHRQYRLPVSTVLLAFTPQAAIAAVHVFGGSGEAICRHFVRVRRIFDEPAEAALALDIEALLPLVTAMRPARGSRSALLADVLERIIERGSPDARRTLMLDQAATFATLHLSRLQVQGIVRQVAERRRYMLDPIRDFPWLRHGYEQGIEKGIEKGMAESVLAFLAARNIDVDEVLRQKILSCHDQTRLRQWIVRSATARSAAEVIECK